MNPVTNSTVHADYVEQIDRNGYTIVEEVISANEVETLGNAVASLPLGDEIRRKRSTYGVRNLLEICPEVRSLAVSEPIRSLGLGPYSTNTMPSFVHNNRWLPNTST